MASQEVVTLVQRLRGRSKTVQAQAAVALARLTENASAQQCDAIAAAGAVRPLVQLLQSSSMVLQAQAAKALWLLLCPSAPVRASIADEGGIQALVPLLGSSNISIQLHAAAALGRLCICDEGQCNAVVAAGGAPALVQLCGSSSSTGVQYLAVSAVWVLTCKDSCVEAVAAAGAVEALAAVLQSAGDSSASAGSSSSGGGSSSSSHASSMRLSGSNSRTLATYAALALGNLAADSPPARQASLVATGVPAALIRLLRSSSSRCKVERLEAATSLSRLAAHGQEEVRAAIAGAGGIAALADLLASSSIQDRECTAAAIALSFLADSPQRCCAIVSAGSVAPLLRLLHGNSGVSKAAQSAAKVALRCIVCCGGPAGAGAVAAAGGAPQTMALLAEVDPCGWFVRGAYNLCQAGRLGPAEVDSIMAALNQLDEGGTQPRENVLVARASLQQVAAAAAEPAAAAVVAAAVAAAAVTAAEAAAAPAGLGVASSPPRGDTEQQQQQQQPPRVCAAPGCSATAGLRRCGGCGNVRYCSQACSKAHWRAHKADCRRLQAELRLPAEAQGSGSSGEV